MPRSLSIEEALQRLETAIGRLETGAEERAEGASAVLGLRGEIFRLGADRSRLAASLDAAEARAARLEETNAAVSRGLVAAMERIRDVLERQGG
jgi:chromosome segregation ATPase